MKFCKDCKHLWGGDMCSSPNLGANLVTGASKRLTAEGLRNMESKLGEVLAWLTQK